MNSSSIADRILQALLEIVGDKFGAEVEAHIMGDREQMVYTVRYITKRGFEDEGACGVRGIAESVHQLPGAGA